jgi:hypothetical protein
LTISAEVAVGKLSSAVEGYKHRGKENKTNIGTVPGMPDNSLFILHDLILDENLLFVGRKIRESD